MFKIAINFVIIEHTNLMEKIYIDYGQRINGAILGVIKDILKDLSESKISSNHCFYISFKTKDKNVKISD